jgi:SAM-dependent methyltransferase
LALFRKNRIRSGLVVDLGCGPGHWVRELTRAGYDALGIDLSPAMIELARKKAPRAEFRVQSLLRSEIPPCVAVTSMGECLNYTFDPKNRERDLSRLFRRVFGALAPGGLFVFDIAEPDRALGDGPRRYWKEGNDWAVLVEAQGDRKRRVLSRRIVCYRRPGKLFRRSEEMHRVRLFDASELAASLTEVGFEVEARKRYGRTPLLPATAVMIGRKPRRG